ncbi:MAG TPA: glycosyltransferase [Solirubrobacterales bacterium]
MNDPLRVLEVFEPRDGGVAEHVRLLAEGLVGRGHDVTVAGRPDAMTRPALEDKGISYMPLPLTGGVPDPLPDLRCARSLSSLLRSTSFDVVHAHGQKAGILARRAARRRRIPSVYTPHAFVYRTQALRPRWSGRLRFRVGLLGERSLARHTAAIVAVADDERKVALRDRIAPADRIIVIHPGVRIDREHPPNESLRDFRGDGPLLGFVAGLRDQKGLPTLLDALELLAGQSNGVRFAIVGNGPLWDEVAARVNAAPLAGQTLLLPFEGDAEAYLRCLDVFVLPSLWEGLPMAVLEAMAAGLPVVASAVNGTPEAVEDGVTGYLVPPGDAPALADRLLAISTDETGRREMGEAAKRLVAGRFGVDRMVDELISVYRSSAAGTAPGDR